MKTKKHYLIVDTKRHRRHSAPENLSSWYSSRQSYPDILTEKENGCRVSVSDFSILLENQSESDSLELDTSNLSRDLSPVPTTMSSPRGSYQVEIEKRRGRSIDEEFGRQGWGSWFAWKNILLSHLIAWCLAIMDVSNREIKNNTHDVVINGQNLPHYILLGTFWTTRLVLRNDGRDIVEVLKFSGFRYLFLSVLHVEANYLLCSSFHHDTYLGNQMIDCVAASLSMIVAYVCLEVQYQMVHISGFGCALVGAIGLSVANTVYKNHDHGDVLLGDVLRMASGICLAFNSIAQEIIIKSIDLVEYMGMIGLVGSLICGIQAIIMEGNKVLPKTPSYWFSICGYSTAQFILSSLTPIVLRDAGATGLHLALTSSGFFSYFLLVLYESGNVQLLYLLSFAAATLGSILFAVKRTTTGTQHFFPVQVVILKSG